MVAVISRLRQELEESLTSSPRRPDLSAVSTSSKTGEIKGVVYTKPWVVDLMLDLAGYTPERDLATHFAVEPSAGEGAFFVAMIRRLLKSLESHGRSVTDATNALHAYELDERAAAHVTQLAVDELKHFGADTRTAKRIAKKWITVGDYLLDSRSDRKADFVIGNPPYIRYDDIPAGAFASYREVYPTMVGRGDIYIGFIEAGLRQLKDNGALVFICADRWMRAAYGTELRRFVTDSFAVDVVIEMHDAPAFENDVAAYPAVIVLRRSEQGPVIVASAGATAGSCDDVKNFAQVLTHMADGMAEGLNGFSATWATEWFTGHDPWPSLEPEQLVLLQYLEAHFGPLEDASSGTKVGIGVATGSDKVFVTTDRTVVEPSRLLPLATSSDTKSGVVEWSGNYLIDPWELDGSGLVNLAEYPLLRHYFEQHDFLLMKRNIARRNERDWYRTIDKVNHELTKRPKLYFPDMKMFSHPTLDVGTTYPHHNLYYVVSDNWDLEVLGGILLSRVAQLFIEAYCVKMRGGTLRFQAQYLRRIRVPDEASLSSRVQEQLRIAFRTRDVDAATRAAIKAYGLTSFRKVLGC